MYVPPPPPDEPTLPQQPRIRPIWLIGGAVLAVLVVCALISVIAATVLIWFSSSISSNALPTRPAVIQNPTPVITAVAPTPLPVISTAPPIFNTAPPAINTAPPALPTQGLSMSSAPDQAVRTYFQLVSQKRFDLTWPMLTNTFKQKFNCCAPNYDYLGYITWWNSVNHVEFGNVSTVSQSSDRAVVYAELYFVMNTGARSAMDSNPYIELAYDSFSGTWQFNDKRASP